MNKELIVTEYYHIACDKARKRHKSRGTQKVVKEGFFYMVMDESKYKSNYRTFCNQKKWNMELVFTSEPIPLDKVSFWSRIKLGMKIWKESRKK